MKISRTVENVPSNIFPCLGSPKVDLGAILTGSERTNALELDQLFPSGGWLENSELTDSLNH